MSELLGSYNRSRVARVCATGAANMVPDDGVDSGGDQEHGNSQPIQGHQQNWLK